MAIHALHRPGFLARLTETWFHRPSTPSRMVLEITRRCNLRCKMCSTWSIAPGHELRPDEVRAMVRQLPKLSWLDVTGGEPFLRADAEEVFLAVVESAPALGVLHFPTNGWFTERVVRVARRLRERRPEVALIITVSIDGPPEVHDELRGRAGSFARAMDTLRRLREIDGVSVYVGTTVTPFNAASVAALGGLLLREIPGFRATDWHWNWLQISQHFFGNQALAALPPVATGNLVREHLRRRGRPRDLVDLMELVFLVNLEFYRRGEKTGIVCQSLRSACFVSPEGDVYPCHVYDRPLGNVRARDFAELWSSPEVLAARRDIERLACGGCFTPCEAYPALAGSPLQTVTQTARRSLKILYEHARPLAHPADGGSGEDLRGRVARRA